MKQVEPTEPIEILAEMFDYYDLSEYRPAFEEMKAEYERVCKENREMRDQLHKPEVKKSA
jgi:HAMP domain-containing protein